MAKVAIFIVIVALACICEAVPISGGTNYGESGNNNPFRNPWTLLDPKNVENFKSNGGQMNAVYSSSSVSRGPDGKSLRQGVILINDDGKVFKYEKS